MKIARESLSYIIDIEQTVLAALKNKVKQAVIDVANNHIPDNLSELANQVDIDYTEVESIHCTNIDDAHINVQATRYIHVVQNYGGKDDPCSINESYPFTFEMRAPLNDPEKFEVMSEQLNVDTSSWYA